MTLPPGYHNKNDNKVCKLLKSLYGLKQAPRKWNEKLSNSLISFGFKQSYNDYSMFVKVSGKLIVFLLVYVDDIIVTGNCESEITKVKEFLKSQFLINNLGKLKSFLDIEVNVPNGICLSQRKYCLVLLHDFGMLSCKPVKTPLESNIVFDNNKDVLMESVTDFQRLIGKLIYLTITRSDISYAVHVLSYFLVILVSWKSKKQSTITRSSTESEYRALSSLSWELIWIFKILYDIGFKIPIPINIFYDNESATKLTMNPVFHDKTKHFETDVHFIREKIIKGVVRLVKISSSNQIVDIFTKSLISSQHESLSDKLSLFDPFSSK
uniref:Reverse transcriptase Ty1/copia-type domain-containing protein n=1 Tax=Lactuca sativa TaxID=4236 RepID=A0A9R1V1P5_LACSA|nr:hypothetical protein LSAT_V11C700360620 [Lactuca sativa]